MERKEEIIILIEYLKQDVIKTANTCSSLLSDTIVKNGKLIETYKNELEEIKRSN